ncbi:hypothetical protein ACROYT_G018780 [Oculina patagonica]
MFQPVYDLNSIWKQDKQVFKIKCEDDLEDLKDMLAKPIVFCASRRQQGEALIDGFDTDFVLLLDPSDPEIAKQINKIVGQVEERLNVGQKFCLKINFSDLLDRLTWNMFKKHVYWLNTEFYITNHCRPNQFLQTNRWLVWCAIFPLFLMASLPYRIQRKACVHDEEINLHVRFKLKFCPNTVLVLHFFSVDQPLPGRYFTHENLPELQECFLLDFEVRPGWIVYNPNVVTVLSCNQMFQPVYDLNSIWNQDKQVFKIKCKDHLEDLKDMLAKPIVFCATRRQQGEALIDGFDTDFVLLLDPSDPEIELLVKSKND